MVVFVDNDKVLDKIIAGGSLTQENASERHWDQISVDLAAYKNKPVVIRLYDLVLVPNHYAGNSYWRHIEIQ